VREEEGGERDAAFIQYSFKVEGGGRRKGRIPTATSHQGKKGDTKKKSSVKEGEREKGFGGERREKKKKKSRLSLPTLPRPKEKKKLV